MALDITSGTLTAIVGLIGILIGALMGPYMNHQLGIRYNRKDLIFKRKLEYFEKVVETMEKNKRIYQNVIFRIENSKNNKETEQIIEELKQNRNNFFIMASPLYFNTRRFSNKIVDFVNIEKDIFNKISELKIGRKKSEAIRELRINLEELNRKSNEIIIEMKKELVRK